MSPPLTRVSSRRGMVSNLLSAPAESIWSKWWKCVLWQWYHVLIMHGCYWRDSVFAFRFNNITCIKLSAAPEVFLRWTIMAHVGNNFHEIKQSSCVTWPCGLQEEPWCSSWRSIIWTKESLAQLGFFSFCLFVCLILGNMSVWNNAMRYTAAVPALT